MKDHGTAWRPLIEQSILQLDAAFLESSTSYGADNLRAAVSGARAAGVDDLMLLPTTADPKEIERAREVLGI